MRYSMLIIGCLFLFACNQQDDKAKSGNTDSSSLAQNGGTAIALEDTLLMKVSRLVLIALKQKDITSLAAQILPGRPLYFSPYAFIDTANAQALTAKQLIDISATGKALKWGTYDGKGTDIVMTIPAYINRFVYDRDFLNAKERSVNKLTRRGNSLNNLAEIFPGASFTEFYFPGTDPKYGGMDWKALRLVFRSEGGRPYLIAIVHDEWTG